MNIFPLKEDTNLWPCPDGADNIPWKAHLDPF